MTNLDDILILIENAIAEEEARAKTERLARETEAMLRACTIIALIEDRALAMAYIDADDVLSIRMVEPFTIKRTDEGETIIQAFDRQRKQTRTFRLDRIITASIID